MRTDRLSNSLAVLAGVCLILASELAMGDGNAPDTAAITAAVEGFHAALGDGHGEKVMALLLPEALIVESGVVQTRPEYEREHLGQDLAFAQAVRSKRKSMTVREEGNVACVTSIFRVTGTFHDSPVDELAAETMVLTRSAKGWRISNIHWSSQRASAAKN